MVYMNRRRRWLMKDFQYFMPTQIIFGKEVIKNNSSLFKEYGSKAMIVTGKNSAKKNGSLDDILEVLNINGIDYCIFDEIEENPSLETVEKGANLGKKEKIDFIIAIGGGSPLDAAKAINILVANEDATIEDLYILKAMKLLPAIAVATTAGTGSETTPYAILTNHQKKTKVNIVHKVFFDVAFLDPKYMMNMPLSITINTALDALSHLVEGYLTVKANLFSDTWAEKGLKLFAECIDDLKKENFTYELREKLILISTIAGVVIAQTGTSLPHGMGYHLTYFHNIAHGRANALLMKAYLEIYPNKERVDNILTCLGFKNLEELGKFIDDLLGEKEKVTKEEINAYAEDMVTNDLKLKNHPGKVTKKEFYIMY
jgi:alcohol dehydrogenase